MWWLWACTAGGILDTDGAVPFDPTSDSGGTTSHATPGMSEPDVLGEADDSPAGCFVSTDYDDDADGTTDRWTRITYDDDGQWLEESLDDGTYVGTFLATWASGCLVRQEGALVDEDGDDWAVTTTQDCDEHGAVTRTTEVWAETPQGGGTVVYGDTTRWTWIYEDDRYVDVSWTSNDGETTHRQTWSWSDAPGPDRATVDLLSDGVIDQELAWTYDMDGDVASETVDGATTTWTRDTRDRLTESTNGTGQWTIWRYRDRAQDHPSRMEVSAAVGGPVTASRHYTWDCAD